MVTNNEKESEPIFEYVKLNYDFGEGVTVEDQAYTYFYSNKTISVDDNAGLLFGPNTSNLEEQTEQDRHRRVTNKLNRYRVYGKRLSASNKDWRFGTLKVGALAEGSDTDRHNILYDLTTGAPDFRALLRHAGPR